MNPSIPVAVTLMFIGITLLTLILFMRAIAKGNFQQPREAARKFSWMIFAWMVVQAVLGFTEFYRVYTAMPPNIFITGIAPAFITILVAVMMRNRRAWALSLDLESLTWFHVIRVPVEFALYLLCTYKMVAPEMTFEGRNFDIISGLTAPVVAWLVFKKNIGGKPLLIIWNFICIGLLFNIVITSVLAAPLPIQKLSFDQPNVAVFFFPFVWLPTVIVPLVLYAHIVSLIKLFSAKQEVQKANV